MPDSSSSVTVPVLAPFRVTDPKTGDPVFYDPDGDFNDETGKGWPGAKKAYTGDPSSDQFKELLSGAGGVHGPLIGEPDKKPAPSSSTASKES